MTSSWVYFLGWGRGRGAGTKFWQVPTPQFHCNRKSPPLASNLLAHVTGSERLRGHSQSTACLKYAQWKAGCEATISHRQLPTLDMLAPGTRKAVKNRLRWWRRWIPGIISILILKASSYCICSYWILFFFFFIETGKTALSVNIDQICTTNAASNCPANTHTPSI